MTDLEDDVIIHVDSAEHRLGMSSLGNDVSVHLDSAKHHLVMIDLEIIPNALLVCSPTPLGRPLGAQSRYLIARPRMNFFRNQKKKL